MIVKCDPWAIGNEAGCPVTSIISIKPPSVPPFVKPTENYTMKLIGFFHKIRDQFMIYHFLIKTLGFAWVKLTKVLENIRYLTVKLFQVLRIAQL